LQKNRRCDKIIWKYPICKVNTLNQTRRNKIVELLEEKGALTNDEMMSQFGISIETVRRDLDYLEKRGLLERVYGGAIKRKFMSVEPNYVSREKKNEKEKLAVATKAVEFVSDNDTVFFDIGTTVLYLASAIANKNINGFTNSLRTAIAISENGGKVNIPGGELRSGEYALSGSIAEENMKRFNIDKAFIGVGGITESGITDFISDEACLRKQVIDNADKVIALCDYSKFGVRAMCNVCKITDIDVLITDDKAPKKILKEIEKQGVKVVVVKA